jgi:hypothetical protein
MVECGVDCAMVRRVRRSELGDADPCHRLCCPRRREDALTSLRSIRRRCCLRRDVPSTDRMVDRILEGPALAGLLGGRWIHGGFGLLAVPAQGTPGLTEWTARRAHRGPSMATGFACPACTVIPQGQTSPGPSGEVDDPLENTPYDSRVSRGVAVTVLAVCLSTRGWVRERRTVGCRGSTIRWRASRSTEARMTLAREGEQALQAG